MRIQNMHGNIPNTYVKVVVNLKQFGVLIEICDSLIY